MELLISAFFTISRWFTSLRFQADHDICPTTKTGQLTIEDPLSGVFPYHSYMKSYLIHTDSVITVID